MNINEIKTPAYVCEKDALLRNLELLKSVGETSGAKILCALKGFAFSLAMPYIGEFLRGATCSGLFEAKYANDLIKGGLSENMQKMGNKNYKNIEIHTYSPAFKDDDMDEILQISNHVVFNSFSQWKKFRQKALQSGVKCGLRVNPQTSFSPVENYNPCGKFSRLGITIENFKNALNTENSLLDGISGLHLHALCEESSEHLQTVMREFEMQFGEFIPRMKWINFGGGHHITKKGYNVELLVKILKDFSQKWGVEVYIEPGEAVGWQCGYLVASVLDIVENGVKIAILDTSAEAHMPDTVLMPYRPSVRGEILSCDKKLKNGEIFSYRFGGNTCLAGDIIGLESGEPLYCFEKPLKIGDRIIFEDQIHYTIVKNTTFNGIKLPDLYLIDKNGEILDSKIFGYDEYKRRN